jgi:hypothetical protein
MGNYTTRNASGSVGKLVREYLKSRRLRESAAEMENKFKKELMVLLETYGDYDDRGSSYLRLNDEVYDPRTDEPVASVKRERRVSQSLDEEVAEEVLKALGLYDRCTTTITVLDEDAILSLNFSGELPDEAVQRMYSEKESFAFKVIGA